MAGLQSKMSGGTKLAITLVAVLILASGLCFYIAQSQFSETYLTTQPPTEVSAKSHDLISFDRQDNLLCVSMKGGKFQIDRYSFDPAIPASHAEIITGPTAPAQWMLASDGKTIGWLTGTSHVSIQRLPFDGLTTWPHPKTVNAPSPLVTFGILADGSTLGMVLARGELITKDSLTGAAGAALPLGARVTWAEIRGDYAAVALNEKLQLLHLVKDAWTVLEEWPDFKDAKELRLPAEGQVVGIMKSGIRLRDEILNAPGKVADVAVTDEGRVIVSGDFPGIYVLPSVSTGEPYVIAEAPPGVQLAASTHALAFTGPAGTVLIRLVYKSRLTAFGRLLVTAATCLIVAAMLIALAFLFIDLQGFSGKKNRTVAKKDSRLPKPPPGLIAAIASGEATLWAGAGVSAPSGFPLRNAFISSVFQTARVEDWARSAQIDQYWKLIADGKSEQALDNFVASDAVMRIRTHDLVQTSFNRFASNSDLQLQLAKLPFNAAITTNYDGLLDRTGAPWAATSVNVSGPLGVLASGSNSIVKLYGDFAAASPLILSRKDFQAALRRNPEFVRDFAGLFISRPIFFLGASIDGLLVDLEFLQAARPSDVRHYCVTGVSSGNWKVGAAQLKAKYNIEVLACDVINIQSELKVFMAELVEAVAQQTSAAEHESQHVS